MLRIYYRVRLRLRYLLVTVLYTFNWHHVMGTKMAPSFANLFLGNFEVNALKNVPFQPHTWLRYIDDIFMIWTEGIDNLKVFIDYLTIFILPLNSPVHTLLLTWLSLT